MMSMLEVPDLPESWSWGYVLDPGLFHRAGVWSMLELVIYWSWYNYVYSDSFTTHQCFQNMHESETEQ